MLFFPLPPPKAQPALSLGHLWNPCSHSHSRQDFSGSELHHLFQLPPTRILESTSQVSHSSFLLPLQRSITLVFSEILTDYQTPQDQAPTPLLGSNLTFQAPFPLQTSPTLILATVDYSTSRCYVLMSSCLWICNSCSQECLSSSRPCCLSGPEFDEVSFGAPQPSILFSRITAISLQPDERCLYSYFTLSSSALFFIYSLWTLTISYVKASTTH